MKGKDLISGMNFVDERFVNEAETATVAKAQKTPKMQKYWGAVAACLCLVVVGTTVFFNNPGSSDNSTEHGSGISQGGIVQEGVDPVVASVAVIPAGENLSNVDYATSVSINEEDAKNIESLGNYLPDILPSGCRYGAAGYYETTMKDGTQYHMVRVTYENGEASVSSSVSENAEIASATTGSSAFVWMVWGHCPDTVNPIYQPEEVTPQLLEQMNGETFYIDYDSVYVGISQLEISTEELMTIINSISSH